MDKNNYWIQFIQSGKIEDYLLFKGMISQEEGKETRDQSASICNGSSYPSIPH